MRAMRITELGQSLTLADVPEPSAGPGEIVLRVTACGVNFADTLMLTGRYQEKPPLPLIPGMEVCGTVAGLGAGVEGFTLGQRVAALNGHGGFAEYVATPAAGCVAVPDAMPDSHAAAFQIAYATSHIALAHRAALRPGEKLVVLGAAGGVGLTAVEIGHLLGAEVIAVARGAEKRAIARAAGADHDLEPGDDLRAAIRARGGADVLYDPVGGDLFDAALRACNPGARILPLGFASGDVPRIPANILLVKNMSVLGFYLVGFARAHPAIFAHSLSALFAWYLQGRIRPRISNTLPLEQANEALDMLRDRTATGKVVLEIAG